MRHLANIYRLGIKELWSLLRDPIMLILVVYAFTVAVYIAATATPDSLRTASIAIVDEDQSALSARIASAFYPPHFMPPQLLSLPQVDPSMDSGKYTFILDIPPNFQRDVLAHKAPAIQLNVDATRMSQSFTGNNYIQQIALTEVQNFLHHATTSPVELVLRARFNPNLTATWFGAVMELNNIITMLSIILTGAALIREREHGTIEHLLVMPVTPVEIMSAKIWSMALVVLLATILSITFIIRGALHIPITTPAIFLFLLCVTLHLFATTSMGIFLATIARSMPQFGLLMILVLLPLQMLSGGMTPRESMPLFAKSIMLIAPTTHFISATQAILYRNASIKVVWSQFLALLTIGSAFFLIALGRFRKTISQMV